MSHKVMPKKRTLRDICPIRQYTGEEIILQNCRKNALNIYSSVDAVLNVCKESKKRDEIKSGKRKCWKKLCDKVDCDIFGNNYKIVI